MRLFVFSALLVGFAASALGQAQSSLSEAPGPLEYGSVAEAMKAAKAMPGAVLSVTKPDGWVIVNEDGGKVVWSFTPEGNYAHPAVVRRALTVSQSGDVRVETRARCEARKEPCDRLIREFQEMNERIRQNIQQRFKQRQ